MAFSSIILFYRVCLQAECPGAGLGATMWVPGPRRTALTWPLTPKLLLMRSHS